MLCQCKCSGIVPYQNIYYTCHMYIKKQSIMYSKLLLLYFFFRNKILTPVIVLSDLKTSLKNSQMLLKFPQNDFERKKFPHNIGIKVDVLLFCQTSYVGVYKMSRFSRKRKSIQLSHSNVK